MESIEPLEPHEARVLGVLIEKELTVPDQYPLSLNATTAGCNQKSNRNPQLSLSDTEVQMQIDKLVVAGYAGRVVPATSRVERFRHNIREHLKLDNAQASIMAELMMRGPQSRSELRTRASRMCKIDSLETLARHLQPLLERGLVKHLGPAPGSRAERVAQCLAPHAHGTDEPAAPASRPPSDAAAPSPSAMEDLRARVTKLEQQLANLAGKLGEPLEED